MLMVRRKRGRWIHCINKDTGQPISLQIKDVRQVGNDYQVTVAVLDDPRHYEVLKPGDRDQAPLEGPTSE